MEKLEYLHQVPTTQHPNGPACINGHVYELTYDEVQQLKILKDIKSGKIESIKLPETIVKDSELLKKQKTVIDILKGHLDDLIVAREQLGEYPVQEYAERIKDITSQICDISDRIIEIFKLARIKS